MNRFKKLLSVITLLLIIFVAYKAFTGELELDGQKTTMLAATAEAFGSLNLWIMLLLLPEQILMYYAAGQIYFAFLKQHKSFKISTPKLTRVSLEINFVNHAIPSGGVSGLAYLVWRLKEMNVTAGQVSFIHVLRYAICALANTVQTWIAIVIVLVTHQVTEGGMWALWLASAVALGIEFLVLLAWLVVRKQKNVDFLSDKAVKIVNRVVRKLTRGKKRRFLREETVAVFFGDLRNYYLRIMRQKKMLWRPVAWGMLYSFLELAVYWVVACALGYPGVLPQIMIAEGLASVVGTVMVTPGGVGGYEAAMIAALAATGVPLHIATITVAVTRVCVLVGTIVTGYPFYQAELMSRKDRFQPLERGLTASSAEASDKGAEASEASGASERTDDKAEKAERKVKHPDGKASGKA